jgi:hypothetical protein
MKKIIVVNLLFVSMFAFSQTSYDTRLSVKYSEEYIQSLSVEKLHSLEFSLDNIYIIDENFEKNESLPELFRINNSTKEIIETPLSNIDFNNFNILEYSFVQNYNTRNYYKIGNTGKTLVILSMKEYVVKLNEYRN